VAGKTYSSSTSLITSPVSGCSVVQLLDLVAEHLDPDRQLLVDRDDLDGVAADPERAAGEGHVVAGVLDVDQRRSSWSRSISSPTLSGTMRSTYSCGVPRP
jgi:hypothetical protein